MDICIMELSAFLFFAMLIPLIASETTTKNIGVFLYSICVRFVKYILYGEELHVKELNGIHQDEVLAPKETLDYGPDFLEISTLPIHDSTSTKDLLTSDVPAKEFTINSCSTEMKDAHPYLQDAISEDFAKLPQRSEASWCSLTKENGKGFDILTRLPDNEPQNHYALDIPVGTQTNVVGKESDGKTFNTTRSEEIAQSRLDHLKTSVAEISTTPYPVKARTNDDLLQDGTNHSELVLRAFEVCDIEKKQSVEEENSFETVISNDVLLAGDASSKCEIGNITDEIEIDEISLYKRSALGSVPMEFIYPCLPYFNP